MKARFNEFLHPFELLVKGFHDEMMLVKTRHGASATKHCAPRAAASTGQSWYKTCLVGADGRHLEATCSRELTGEVLNQH
jgi:hypothetical protein